MYVEEPLAYPYSTLCLYLIVRMLVRPTRWWVAATVVAASIAPFVRGELVVIWAVLVLALVFTGLADGARPSVVAHVDARATGSGSWCSCSESRSRSARSSARRRVEWLLSTDHYKSRLFDLGFNAAGALTIGLGVLPVVAGLASLWRGPGEQTTPRAHVVSRRCCSRP